MTFIQLLGLDIWKTAGLHPVNLEIMEGGSETFE